MQRAVTDHQLGNAAWRWRPLVAVLHRYRLIFAAEFVLPLPDVAACVGWTRRRCYGYFRPGPNWFGFEREILLHEAHVIERLERGAVREVLATWLHELLHAWQCQHGDPGRGNYHNAQFRDRSLECGLEVDGRGVTAIVPGGRFEQVLARHGIPDLPVPDGVGLKPAETKLKKWVCICHPAYGVRVAVEDFRALCLKCQQPFALADGC